MNPPIRCFSCGKILYWKEFILLLSLGYEIKEALNILCCNKYCCRRMFQCQII